jgi:hypothetical protein
LLVKKLRLEMVTSVLMARIARTSVLVGIPNITAVNVETEE